MSQNKYFKPLTGLRAIAAILVFFHHNKIRAFVLGDFDIQNEMHIGVGIFFVLSGFLISNRYYNSIETIQNYFRYLFRRFARIYPVYFFLFVLLLFFKVRTTNLEYICTNVFLTKGFYDNLKFNGIAQAWSLAVEFCFYILAPLFFIMGRRFGVKYLLIIGLLLSILIYAYAIMYLEFSESRFLLIYTLMGRIFEFILGIFLGVVVLNHKGGEWQRKTYYSLIGVLGVILILFVLTILKYKYSYLGYGLYHPIGIFLNNFLLPVFVVLLIKGLVLEITIMSKILSTPLFQVLGKASYVFYLIHMGFIYEFVSHSLGFRYQGFVSFVILWVISFILYKFVEEPVNKFLCKYA